MTRRRSALAAVTALAILLLLLLAWWPRPPADDVVPQVALPGRSSVVAPATSPAAPSEPAPDALAEAPPEALPPEWQETLEAHPELPTGRARCNLSPAVDAASGHLVIGDAAQIPYDGRRVEVADSVATLPLVENAGSGVLAIDGFAPVLVTWTEGTATSAARCSPDPVVLSAGEAWLTGHVRNAEGEPEGRVFVEGCGNQALTDAAGSYGMTVVPGTCTVNAFRRDGLLVGKAEATEVVIPPAGEVVTDFVLPELPTAGLGIRIQAEEQGFRILGVVDGTAAADLGLTEGDLVVEVDGTVTAGIPIEEFVDLAVGPVGTEVDIVISRGERLERLTLDRRVISGG